MDHGLDYLKEHEKVERSKNHFERNGYSHNKYWKSSEWWYFGKWKEEENERKKNSKGKHSQITRCFPMFRGLILYKESNQTHQDFQ